MAGSYIAISYKADQQKEVRNIFLILSSFFHKKYLMCFFS